jgi:hypothetical protein
MVLHLLTDVHKSSNHGSSLVERYLHSLHHMVLLQLKDIIHTFFVPWFFHQLRDIHTFFKAWLHQLIDIHMHIIRTMDNASKNGHGLWFIAKTFELNVWSPSFAGF